nr:hypothetical protein F41B5.1 - Caenorhabditis elegans [Caenorhabditis elegans]
MRDTRHQNSVSERYVDVETELLFEFMSSKVWLFFDGRNTGNDAKCSLCGSIIKKTKSGSTSPQIAHLKTFHGEEWSRALGKETSSSREISVEKDPEPAENNDDETTRMAPVFWQRKKTQNEQYMDDNSAEARSKVKICSIDEKEMTEKSSDNDDDDILIEVVEEEEEEQLVDGNDMEVDDSDYEDSDIEEL